MTTPPVLIVDLGIAHQGHVVRALEHVRCARDSGADAIKMQHHSLREMAPGHPWKETIGRCLLSDEHHAMIRNAARILGLQYGSTPFSVEALDRILALYPDFIKLGGGTVTNEPLVQAVIAKWRGHVIISEGCASHMETTRAFIRLAAAGNEVTVLRCVSRYPTLPEHADLRTHFGETVAHRDGYSDHSATPWAGVIAVWEGATTIEVHAPKEGPDAESSLSWADVRALRHGMDWAWKAREGGMEIEHDPEVERLARYTEAAGWRRSA